MESGLKVLVCPRASKNGLAGWQGDHLKIRLTSPPVDGAANAALIKFLAELLGIPARNVQLVSGQASRRKRLKITGLDTETLRGKLAFGAPAPAAPNGPAPQAGAA